jgi:hypothetical protein
MDSFNRVVFNMMARYGGMSTATVVGEGVYNDDTREFEATATVYDIQTMVFDYTLQSNGDQTQKNTLIQAGDKQVFVRPLADMPRLQPGKDTVQLGGKSYRIVTYKELNPSGLDNCLIELYVRT